MLKYLESNIGSRIALPIKPNTVFKPRNKAVLKLVSNFENKTQMNPIVKINVLIVKGLAPLIKANWIELCLSRPF